MRGFQWLVCVFVGLVSACSLAQDDKAAEAEMLVTAAIEAGSRADHAQVIGLCDQVIALDPSMHRAYVYRGLALEMTGRREAAFRDYAMGRELRLAEALRPADERLKADPEDVEAHVMRATILEDAGRTDDAYAEYARASALQPDDLRARVGLVRMAWGTGRTDQEQQRARDDSLAAAKRVLARNGDDALARAIRMQQACMAGSTDAQVAEDYGFVLDHAGGAPEAAFEVLTVLVVAGDYQSAAQLAERVLQGRSEPWRLHRWWSTRTVCHMQTGELAAAEQDAMDQMRAAPLDEMSHLNLAEVVLARALQAAPEEAARMRVSALQFMHVAVALDPADAAVLYQRGMLRQHLGDREGSDQDLADALRLDPDVEQSPRIQQFLVLVPVR